MPEKKPEPANWEPQPDGPPPAYRSKYAEMRAWLKANPGQWAVVHGTLPGSEGAWRMNGYEVVTRKNNRKDNRRDMYIRWPVQEPES